MEIKNSSEMKKALPALKKSMSDGCTVILNHSEHCFHCIKFMPEWNRFEKSQQGSLVKIIKIEGSAYGPDIDPELYRKLSDNLHMYFPMVIVFVNGTRYMYDGPRSSAALTAFVASKKPVAATKKPATPVNATKKPATPVAATKKPATPVAATKKPAVPARKKAEK